VLSIRYFRLVSSDDVLTAWVAIDDADSENGALRYIVGAHVEGIVPHAISNHAEPYNINANLSAGYLQAADEVRPTS
jgi:ectoine hydroxylase-related dioxygenase (phytanoyl-CoA dioxygenase family)